MPLIIVLGIWYYKKRKLAPLMVGHGALVLATGMQILMKSISPAIFETMSSMAK